MHAANGERRKPLEEIPREKRIGEKVIGRKDKEIAEGGEQEEENS